MAKIKKSKSKKSSVSKEKQKKSRASVNTKELKEYLLKKINDKDNLIENEKVNRYISFVKIIANLEAAVKEHGYVVKVENFNQTFYKANPALAEITKINAAMLAIEKTWNFDIDLDSEDDLL